VALADKLDTLVGIFAIGDRPTGVRDPFALRRAALGVLKILIKKQRGLDLEALLARAAGGFPAELSAGEAVGDVFEFMMNRLKAEYESPEQDYTPQQVAAVLACRPTRPLDFDRRLRAVKAFSEMDEAETLSAANKRTANILKKSGVDNTLQVDGKRLNEPAEKALFEAIEKVAPRIEPLCRKGEYTRALQTLAGLRQPVDRFFDEVLVMADEPALRENRLALLQRLSGLFTAIADIALLNQ
jgi:glycyl-tRNA synthetase beta chain